MMASALENLILRLLSPSNEALSEGFGTMREAFKDPNINVALCECMSTSQNAEVRKYAAVLLRKKLLKTRQWRRVPSQIKIGIKQTILQLFVSETDRSAHSSVTELMAVIAKHEVHQGKWPELMHLLSQYIQSNNPKEKEMGLYAMSVITSAAAENMKPYLKSLLSQFSKTLLDNGSINIPFHTVECLTSLVCCVGSEEMNQFQSLIPSVLQVIRHLVTADEAKACKALEIFDELVESEVGVIVPHIKPLIGFCLELAGSTNLQPNIRVKALSIISWLARLKQKTILKHKLVSPILDVLFPIMCQATPGDGDQGDEEEDDLSPGSSAAQVIDMMALNLPPEKLLLPLMHHLEKALKSDDPYHRKAAYLALSVVAEGCSEYIKNKYLQNFLQVICKGMKETDGIVRNSALYCLGQFAEHLQPDISKFSSELLPVLFEYLHETCQMLTRGEKDPPGLSKTFYAVETFCENLGNELLPYLPTLMELLMSFLSTNSVGAKELAISAIGAVASAAGTSFLPYFHAVIENLKVYISEKTKENMPLKIQAIDTLSQLARTLGPEHFMPMANDCMVLGLELVDQVDDPDLRRCVYNLFAAVSTILKGNMAQYLSLSVDHMIGSIQSTEGINAHYVSEERSSFTLFDDVDDDYDEEEDIENGEQEDEEEDGDEIAGFSVENAYMEEKESAVAALKEMSSNLGVVFIPYVDKCFDEVKKLLESPSLEVRREAVACLGQFCITLNEVFIETGSLEYRLNLDQKVSSLLPKLFATAREDTERRVVLACLETIQEMVEKMKKNFVYGSAMESIVALIKDVFKHKLACQGEEGDDEELDDQEAEYDTMLFEYAGDIIPALVKTVQSQQFAPYFAGLLPFLLPKTKRSCSVSEKSFSIGTLAEVINYMDPGSARPFLNHVLPVFLHGMTDNDDEVRSNSVFGLGVLIQNVTESLFDQYPALLQALSSMLAKEQNPRAKDNLCGAVARMITVNISAIPLKQVLPAFLQCLPLQVDMEENITVYRCLSLLHSHRCEEFFQNLPAILKILSQVLSTQELNDETKVLIAQLVKDVQSEFPSDFETVLKSLPPEGAETLMKVLDTASPEMS